MIIEKNYINDEDFEKISSPFYDNFNEYLSNFIMPEVVSFYLASGHYRDCLSESSLENHINSVRFISDINYNFDVLISQIKEILRVKYNLKIIQINPLKPEKLY